MDGISPSPMSLKVGCRTQALSTEGMVNSISNASNTLKLGINKNQQHEKDSLHLMPLTILRHLMRILLKAHFCPIHALGIMVFLFVYFN